MRQYLALAACLALAGSVAHAAPGRHGKQAKKVAPPADDDADEDDAPHRKHARVHEEEKIDRVAFGGDLAEDELEVRDELDAPVKPHRSLAAPEKDWRLAIGPYLWASAVDANVSLGPTSIGTGIDFDQMSHHAKYGGELLAEARYQRFSLFTDLMYGVVGLQGATMVGPLAVSLDATASSLMIDSAGGYTLFGGEQSLVTVVATGGVRYQRTAISGALGVSGNTITAPEQVTTNADAVAGARIYVRPSSRFYVSAAFDHGVVGTSSSTWSAAADASVQLTTHTRLSLGYRTLTTDGAMIDVVMHGPRAAFQLTF